MTKPLWKLNVVSSTIKQAQYNVAKEKLMIVFVSGDRYVYDDVTVEEFTEFTLAESQGKWFHQNIKPKTYRKIK